MKSVCRAVLLLSTSLGCAAVSAEVLNVLALGAKNDGSADVSAIVNANTAKGALFFPAGIYKVAHPLVLKNSIRGEGYARLPRVDATRTWLVSEIVCTNGAVGVIELDGVSGGVASPGAGMVCMAAAPLYKSNPAGNQFRSQADILDTVQPGATVKLFEYGAQYCKVICNGKIGWIETDLLANM